jgi:hypothetical protein
MGFKLDPPVAIEPQRDIHRFTRELVLSGQWPKIFNL